MPRLFTGLEVPMEAREALARLRGGLTGARWVEPDDYHLTLRFLGDVDTHTATDFAAALDRVERPRLALALTGLDAFGGNRPHAVWARVEADPALVELQAEHERLARRVGLPAETRRFTPHVTLARLRGIGPPDVALWLERNGDFRSGPFAVTRFVLFSARASTGGGPYVVEEVYPLAAAA
jgi:2'-5' RNA ligase